MLVCLFEAKESKWIYFVWVYISFHLFAAATLSKIIGSSWVLHRRSHRAVNTVHIRALAKRKGPLSTGKCLRKVDTSDFWSEKKKGKFHQKQRKMRISLLFRSKRLVHFLSLVSASKSDLMLAFLIHSWLPENKRAFAVLRSWLSIASAISCVDRLQLGKKHVSTLAPLHKYSWSMGLWVLIPYCTLNILDRFILYEDIPTCIPSLYGGGYQSFAGGSGNSIKSLISNNRKGMLSASFCCLLIFMKGIESKVGAVERFQ